MILADQLREFGRAQFARQHLVTHDGHCRGFAGIDAPVSFAAHQHGELLLIGHRGAAGLAPENTLPSFALAAAHGCDAVELDVHYAHGELLVIHDATLERTTNGRGGLQEHSLAALRELDAGNGARIPTLAEVLAALPRGLGVNVELKGTGTATPVAALLGDGTDHDVLVSSFNLQRLKEFHELAPRVPVAPLFSSWRRDAWRLADALGAWSINLAVRLATRERIAAAHERGLRVLVYTVNDKTTAARLTRYGVDGLFTDYPDGRLG